MAARLTVDPQNNTVHLSVNLGVIWAHEYSLCNIETHVFEKASELNTSVCIFCATIFNQLVEVAADNVAFKRKRETGL